MIDTDALGALTLTDAQEQPVLLQDLWRDQAVVLVFVRHFG